MYKYIQRDLSKNKVIIKEENNMVISFVDPSPGNTEYEAYLKWVAEGNVAEEVIDGN